MTFRFIFIILVEIIFKWLETQYLYIEILFRDQMRELWGLGSTFHQFNTYHFKEL